MYVIREVFTAKPGQASKLAKLFKKAFGNEANTRVMTDVVGNYNTVVMEMQVKSVGEFEQMMEDYKSGKVESRMDPKVADEMSRYTEMYLTGRREIYQLID